MSLEFSRDGTSLASASSDGTARVWDPCGEDEPRVVARADAPILDVAWSGPNRIVTAGRDQGVPGLVRSASGAFGGVARARREVALGRDVAPADFDALEFVLRCARSGRVAVGGRALTLLTAPMAGFYSTPAGQPNPGRTQIRIAYIERPENMRLVPQLLAELFDQYRERG